MRTFGLSNRTLDTILRVFSNNPLIEEAVIYGARATGTYRAGSDIDISLKGANLSFDSLLTIDYQLLESSIPHRIDLVIHEHITNAKFRSEIDLHGVTFYQKTSSKKLAIPMLEA